MSNKKRAPATAPAINHTNVRYQHLNVESNDTQATEAIAAEHQPEQIVPAPAVATAVVNASEQCLTVLTRPPRPPAGSFWSRTPWCRGA